MSAADWLSRLRAQLVGGGAQLGSRPRLTLATTPDVIYAIGDVHGCLEQLREIEALIVDDAQALTGSKLIVILGDLVDRGPSSAQVLDHLLKPPPAGFERICLAGNHDEMMLRFLDAPAFNMDWLELGGDATLSSYGIDVGALRALPGGRIKPLLAAHVPAEHRTFLTGLAALAVSPDYIFVHAGLKSGVAPDEQTEADLLWYRDRFAADYAEFGKVVVHGHMPVPEPHVSRWRLGLDTAAFATGRLSAARLVANKPPLLLATKPRRPPNA